MDNLTTFVAFIIYGVLDITLIWLLVTGRYQGLFLSALVLIIYMTVFVVISGRQMLDDFRHWYHGK